MHIIISYVYASKMIIFYKVKNRTMKNTSKYFINLLQTNLCVRQSINDAKNCVVILLLFYHF